MANRSYLYSYHPGLKPEYRDIAEWNYVAPVSHLLLVGANPIVCQSVIWRQEANQKIAIKGEAVEARSLFLDFLKWLAPQLSSSSFNNEAEDARKILTRSDRQGSYYHLEAGETYGMAGLNRVQMEAEAVEDTKLAKELFIEVRQVVRGEGTTLDDCQHKLLQNLKSNWSELGLYFSHISYFSLGSEDT